MTVAQNGITQAYEIQRRLKVWQPAAPLANNKIYYWRIVAKDANGATCAREWFLRPVCTTPPTAVAL